MPSSMEILDRLTALAGAMAPLAIAWHAVAARLSRPVAS